MHEPQASAFKIPFKTGVQEFLDGLQGHLHQGNVRCRECGQDYFAVFPQDMLLEDVDKCLKRMREQVGDCGNHPDLLR